MVKEGAASQHVQNLGKGCVHPCPFSGCEDDGYEGGDRLVMHVLGKSLRLGGSTLDRRNKMAINALKSLKKQISQHHPGVSRERGKDSAECGVQSAESLLHQNTGSWIIKSA